jgi:hypothetical protein
MLEMFKLRLRDGTVLVVDHGALSTWLVDGKAMVQPVGSERWLPLRQFLAKEKAEAASAARRNPTPEEIPVARQPPLPSERSLPPVEPPPLPAVVEPPPLPPASEAPVWSSPPPVFASEPPVVWAPAEEITVEPPTPDEAVSIAAAPSAYEPEAPLFTDIPSPSEPPAPLLSVSEPPEVWAPTEEAAAVDEATAQPPPLDEEVEVAALPEADGPEAPAFVDDPYPSQPPVALPSISLPPEVWAPTEEAAALYEATAAELYESTARPPAAGDEDALWHTAAQAMNEARATPRSLNPRDLQVLADATVASRGRSKAPSTSHEGLIALKPLDDEEEDSRRAAQPTLYEGPYEGDEVAERATGLESSFLGLAPPWDARLRRWLDVLSTWVARLGRGLDRHTPRDPAATARTSLSRLRSLASLWTERASKWRERLTRRDVPAPSPPSGEAPRAGTAGPPLRKPAMPPPPLSELPVLRFKTDDSEAEGAGDHDIYQDARSFDVVWLWLKRLTLITALVVGGLVAARTREAWWPAATRLARELGLEIPGQERARAPSVAERPAQIRALLPALAEQLPHLRPETIALVMSRSPATVVDPPEVFARAYDATERGLKTLSAPEAEELGALQRAQLSALLPAERQRVREYDLVRARRAPLPGENRDVLRSFARGARALPSWARERLQELSGKTIAAGLALPPDASPQAATAP